MSTIRTRPRPIAGQIRRPALRMGHRYRSPLMDGLASHWSLGEFSAGTGAVTRSDSWGTMHLTDNGTVPSSTTSVRGDSRSADFETTNNFLRRADEAGVTLGDEAATLLLWVFFDVEPAAAVFLAGKGTPNSTSTSEYGIWVTADTPEVMRAEVCGASNLSPADANPNPVPGTKWIFVCLRHDPAANTVQIYYRHFDGAAVTASGAHTQGITDKSKTFNIGSNDAGGDDLNGKVMLVSLFRKLLTDNEVAEHFNQGNGLPFPF